MQCFRLSAPTIAIQHEGGKDVSVMLPEGAAISTADWAVRNQEPGRLIPAIWEGKPVRLFLADLLERGEHIRAIAGD